VTTLGREIDQIATSLSASGAAAASHDECGQDGSEEERLKAALGAKLPELAAAVDARLQAEYIQQHGGLVKLIFQGGRPRTQLAAKLHELSRHAVMQSLAEIDSLAANRNETSSTGQDDLRSGLTAATPPLLEFGGTRRVLAILPSESRDESERARISQALGTDVTTVCGSDSSLTLCVEANHLSLPHIAVELIQHRRDRVEFAQRVHCRTDIAWSPLVPTSNASSPTNSGQELCKTLVM